MAFRLGIESSHTVLCVRPPVGNGVAAPFMPHGCTTPRIVLPVVRSRETAVERRTWRCDGVRTAGATSSGTAGRSTTTEARGMGGEESECLIVCAGQRVASGGNTVKSTVQVLWWQ